MSAQERKKGKRRVFGRLKGVEGYEGLYTLELTKFGCRVRRRCSRKVELIPIPRLCEGGSLFAKVGGTEASFVLTADGLEVGRRGSKAKRLIRFAELLNLAERQPVLFPELLEEEK